MNYSFAVLTYSYTEVELLHCNQALNLNWNDILFKLNLKDDVLNEMKREMAVLMEEKTWNEILTIH